MLLFDENLSASLVRRLADIYPDCKHVCDLLPAGSSDDRVWAAAKAADLTVVSKDTDFRLRSTLYGSPPKVIWLSVENAGTAVIADLLRTRFVVINHLRTDPDTDLLMLRV
jgi:predicted nuclease of predicted toxin-antitoxin system